MGNIASLIQPINKTLNNKHRFAYISHKACYFNKAKSGVGLNLETFCGHEERTYQMSHIPLEVIDYIEYFIHYEILK